MMRPRNRRRSGNGDLPFGPSTAASVPTSEGFMHDIVSAAKASSSLNGASTVQLSRKFVARRISEGETGRLKEELKCQACGKGYKHVSSLAKHLWEHTPEWNVTSKLLISKHQQVQLLEAASILVSMNEEEESDEEDSATPEIDTVGPYAKDDPSPPIPSDCVSSPPPAPLAVPHIHIPRPQRSISKHRNQSSVGSLSGSFAASISASIPRNVGPRGRRLSQVTSESQAPASSLNGLSRNSSATGTFPNSDREASERRAMSTESPPSAFGSEELGDEGVFGDME